MKLLRKIILTALAAAVISGCEMGNVRAKADVERARDTMEKSKVMYRDCLQAEGGDKEKCVEIKRMYEADRKAYEALSGTK